MGDHAKSPERGPEGVVSGGETASRAGDLPIYERVEAWLETKSEWQRTSNLYPEVFLLAKLLAEYKSVLRDRDRLDRDLDTALCRIAVLEGRTVATP